MWFSLSLVGFFGQLAGGARWSLVLALSSTIVGGATALLSIKYGYGRFHRRDAIALLVTVTGIALSLVYDNPLIVVGVVAPPASADGISRVGLKFSLGAGR